MDLPHSSGLWVQSVTRSPRRARARAGDIADSASVLRRSATLREERHGMLGCFATRSHRQSMRSFPDVVSLYRGRMGLGATKIFPEQGDALHFRALLIYIQF